MTNYLEVAYLASHSWCYPLLNAVQANPKLTSKHKVWSSHRLSDLAFAIDGRLRALNELTGFMNQYLGVLGQALFKDQTVSRYLRGDYAYRFSGDEEIAVQRVLLGAVSFVREARSCFENLADFRAEFLAHYVGTQVGDKKARYDALNRILRKPKWTDDLRRLRDDLSHYRYPWLAFKVRKRRLPKYEPVLVLNWRSGALGPADRVPLHRLRRIRSGLGAAVKRVVQVLRKRIS